MSPISPLPNPEKPYSLPFTRTNENHASNIPAPQTRKRLTMPQPRRSENHVSNLPALQPQKRLTWNSLAQGKREPCLQSPRSPTSKTPYSLDEQRREPRLRFALSSNYKNVVLPSREATAIPEISPTCSPNYKNAFLF